MSYQKPGNLLTTPTFSGKSDRKCCRNSGDVNRKPGREHNREIGPKIREPPLAVERQRSEIPVDNLEFSTFSTGFSTRVFHIEKWLKNGVVFFTGRHNLFRRTSTNFYFSGAVHFDYGPLTAEKKWLDKEKRKKLKIF